MKTKVLIINQLWHHPLFISYLIIMFIQAHLSANTNLLEYEFLSADLSTPPERTQYLRLVTQLPFTPRV